MRIGINEKFKYLAMDDNGLWYVYETIPIISFRGLWWCTGGGENFCLPQELYIPYDGHWRNSLHKINPDGTFTRFCGSLPLKNSDMSETDLKQKVFSLCTSLAQNTSSLPFWLLSSLSQHNSAQLNVPRNTIEQIVREWQSSLISNRPMTVGMLKDMLTRYPDDMQIVNGRYSDYEIIKEKDWEVISGVDKDGWVMASRPTMSSENREQEKEYLYLKGN